MWSFAHIKVKNKVVLAPMAGITTLAYRLFMKPFGVGLSYTEMVSDCGIIYDSVNTKKYCRIDPNEGPIGLQLFGSKKETLIKAIKKLETYHLGYDFLDINLGCPMPKVTKSGAGSAWLNRPSELFEMMKEVVKVSSKPVSAKIRIGSDDQHINVLEIVKLLEEAGVSLITIHTRTIKQIYQGKARHEVIKDLGLKMEVPLIISGDINSIDTAQYALNMTKASAVMVARGGLGKPQFITQLDKYFSQGIRLEEATLLQQLIYLRRFAKLLMTLKGEDVAIKEIRGLGVHFLSGYPGMKKYKAQLTQIADYEQLLDIIRRIRQKQYQSKSNKSI